jgi:hypothetical protein
MAKHQQHTAVTEGHGHALTVRDFALVKHPTQNQYQGGIEEQN